MAKRLYELSWSDEDPATPALIVPLIDGFGELGDELRRALIDFAQGELEGFTESGNVLTMHELNLMLWAFEAGTKYAKQETVPVS